MACPIVIKHVHSGVRQIWAQITVLPSSGSVILSKSVSPRLTFVICKMRIKIDPTLQSSTSSIRYYELY